VRFAELADVYDALSKTTLRLEMRKHLVELVRRIDPSDLTEVIYLSQGMLRPEYEGVELGVADSLARRAVAVATGTQETEVAKSVRQTGDLGTTAYEFVQRMGRPPPAAPLTVGEVYSQLVTIARASGAGSQETKIQALVTLLGGATPAEAKYIVRFVLGQLRLGVREMTIVDALTQAFGDGTKDSRATIEGAYNVCSDLGVVARTLAERGMAGLAEIRVTVGRPIRPMLSERSPDLTDVMRRMAGRAALEYKYDGLRVQAHVTADGPPKLFSRRLEDISGQFPELVAELPKVLAKPAAIVEGECVAVDPDTEELRPFQEISRRRGRKYDLERMQTEVPVRLFLFDCLMSDGETMLDSAFPERRRRLEETVREGPRIRLAIQKVAESVDEAQLFFDQAIADGCEGVMAKSLAPGSVYRAGARGYWWIKYKREYTHQLGDSIDGVVVGALYGRGRRAGKYGALLLAVYNPDEDRFESFCKVGSGFDDKMLAELPKKLAPLELEEAPDDVLTGLVPDRWIRPSMVLEVRGAELSLSPIHRAAIGKIRPDAGLALRFPRFTGRVRDDKEPSDATTSTELLDLYRTQVRKPAKASPAAAAEAAG
jgi:DNA ligase-1